MAVGAAADLIIQPYGALIIGSIAGLVSVFGFEYVSVRASLDLFTKAQKTSFPSCSSVYWIFYF